MFVSLKCSCHVSNILQVPKDSNCVMLDMAMRAEMRFVATNTELEALKIDFAEMKRVDEGRCATVLHQQSMLEKLTAENGELKRRLYMIKFERGISCVLVILAACLISRFGLM